MAKNNKNSLLNLNVNIGGVSLTKKALFTKHLSVMLKSGLTLSEALAISADSAQGKLRQIINGLLRSVEAGNSLSSSFEAYPKVFTGLFISVTYSGESSGTLDESLENIALQLKKEKELVAKIKGAMLYPVVILIAAFFLAIAMSFVVLPKITPLFEGLQMDLPLTTRWLIAFSNFVQNHGLILLVSIFIFIVAFLWVIKQKFFKPISHFLFLKVPIISRISKGANLARFCRSLGTLLKSGLTVDEAFEITKDTLGNFYYKKVVEKVSKSVGKGNKISENLENYKSYFPIMVTRMIKVGEESGRLEDTLDYLADFYEVEVENSTKSLSTAIEPVLLVLIGLVVGFLALSIITPIYNITGGIK